MNLRLTGAPDVLPGGPKLFISYRRTDSASVASTLLIAALFQPLRSRIQRSIDRRFHRHSDDAALTVARFSETLRTNVDLTTLMDHLAGVVDETMRPAHVSLWLQRDEREQNRG